MSKELEEKVTAYAKNHPVKNIAVHAGPLAVGGAGSLVAGFMGLSFAVPIILVVIFLVLMKSMQSFNKKAVAAPIPTSNDIADKAEAEAAEKKVKALMSSEDKVRTEYLSEYDCKNYEQVSFEMKLVDEGVIPIQEVSICDAAKSMGNFCLLCRPIVVAQIKERKEREKAVREEIQRQYEKDLREANRRIEKRATESDKAMLEAMEPADAERVREWQQTTLDNLDNAKIQIGKKANAKVIRCHNHGDTIVETWFIGACPECRLVNLKERDEALRLAKIADAKAKRAAAKAEKKRLFEERRKVNVMGVNILRPKEVPEGAVPSILHGKDLDKFATHSYVIWKWTENGKDTQFYKQPIAIDAYSVSSVQGVIKTFYSAHDAETGEYLGDYSNTVENEKMAYHTKLMQDMKVFEKGGYIQ